MSLEPDLITIGFWVGIYTAAAAQDMYVVKQMAADKIAEMTGQHAEDVSKMLSDPIDYVGDELFKKYEGSDV